jgi:eukaryotic-like serine/threonine-protein kinase
MATCPVCRKRYPDEVATCADDGEHLLPNEAFTGVDVDLSAGQVVGEYRIEGKLGEGGFGAVYKAVHPLIGKAAAIKVLNRQYSANPQMVSRFISEARAVNQIRHRNIIDIFAFGTLEDGRQYFIMELLDGMPLDAYLATKGRLSVEEAVAILRPVARALDAAHSNGIAHRDLKPENIFLGFDDEGHPFPKLLDFGIAKLLAPDATAGGHSKTRTGTPMGTPYYMSPEQCRGKNVDHRTDVYSFGIMLHQVLAGRLPFEGDDIMDLLIKQSTAAAPPLSSVTGDLPPSLDAPILAMLEKDPAARPASVGAAMEGFIEAARAAGYAVGASPAGGGSSLNRPPGQSGPQPNLPSASRPNMTPAQIQVAHAATVAEPPKLQTFQGAGMDVAAVPKKRTLLYVLAPVMMLVGLGVGFVVMKAPAKTGAGNGMPITSASVTASASPSASAAPTAVTSIVVPVLPEEVHVTVKAFPEHAAIYLGDERIGVAPGPVTLKRSADKVKLTLKAEGYAPYDVELEPTDNTVVNAKLTKLAGGGGKKPVPTHGSSSGELEDPFKK